MSNDWMDFEVKDTPNGVHFFGAFPSPSPEADRLFDFFFKTGGERLAQACMGPAEDENGNPVVLVSGYDWMINPAEW